MSYEPTLDEQVELPFPLDGPYSEDQTRAASRAIAALVRYLNHATYSDSATPYPSTVDGAVRSIAAAVSGMDQLLRQLADRMDAHKDEAYSDDGRNPADVIDAFNHYPHAARHDLAEAFTDLQDAGSYGTHLGLRTDEPTE